MSTEASGASPEPEVPPPSAQPRSARRAPPSARSPGRRPPAGPPRHPLLLPLAAAYALVLFASLLFRHRHFGSPTLELGAYHSVLYNFAFHGTPWNSIERAHQWSTHIEPALVLLAPLYRISPSPIWLWLAESLACAAAALPADALARRVTGDAVIGVIVAAATLLAPQLVLGQLADFHVLALCALPVAVMAWAVEVDSSRGLALGALGAMALREQMGFVVALAALLWIVRQGRRRAIPAVALALLATSVAALEIFVIIPAMGSGQAAHVSLSYGNLGGTTPDEVVRSAAKDPVMVVRTLLNPLRARYVLEVLSGAGPLALLALRSLRRAAWPLVVALPQLLIQLLSSSWTKWDIGHPYGMPLVPLISVAAVLALALVPTDRHVEARRLVATGWLALSLVHLAGKLPLPVGAGRPLDPGFAASPRAAALARAIAAVPAEASVSAQDDVVPHLAARSEIHLWPDGRHTDEYILLDVDGIARNVQNRAFIVATTRQLRVDPEFEVVVDEAGVILAKRLPR
jgi:uncharacterized membrane protein